MMNTLLHTYGFIVSSADFVPISSGLSGLLCVIYAILIVICGVIFPITETLQDQWLKTWYNGFFIFYFYTLGTLIYIYMQIVLVVPDGQCNRRHCGQSNTSADSTNKYENQYVNHGFTCGSLTRPMVHSFSKKSHKGEDEEDGAILDNKLAKQYEMSNEEEQPSKKQKILYSSSFDANKSKSNKQHVTAVLKFNSTTHLNSIGNLSKSAVTLPTNDKDNDDDAMSEVTKRHNSMLQEIPTVDEMVCEEEEITEEVFIDLSELGNIFSHNGSSFFLRIGTLLFGVGHIIYIILEIQQSWVKKPGCEMVKYWWVFICRLIFVVIQTFVIFKNPAISVPRSQKALFRFGFMHIIASNFCVWIRTLLSEIILEANYLSKYNHDSLNSSGYTFLTGTSYNCTSGGILQMAAPYLFPFVMEYSLLCISVAAVMYWSISEECRDNIEKGITNLFKIDVFEKDGMEDTEEMAKPKKLGHHHPHGLSESEELFNKSHRGIYTGFMFLTGIIVSIVFFNFSYGSLAEPTKGELIASSCEIIMAALILFVAAAAIYQLRHLSFINKPGTIDDYLLMIAMFGGLMYLVCIIMAGFNALQTGLYRSLTLESLRICESFVGVAQIITQVILIIGGLRRYPSKQSHVAMKPGRGSLTFLVIANVSAWIFHSVITKTHDLQYSPTNLFGKIPWIIMINITVPLLLFFYFHSSVCLADVWHQAYVPLQQSANKQHVTTDNNENNTSFYHNEDVFDESSPKSRPSRNVPQQKSALSFLSPLMRSVSVSQIGQTKNISSNIIDEESSFNRSLSEIPQQKIIRPSRSVVARIPLPTKSDSYNDYNESVHI